MVSITVLMNFKSKLDVVWIFRRYTLGGVSLSGRLCVILSCSSYPNEVIVSFETNTYGVFTPSHGLWNIWSTEVPLSDKKQTLQLFNQ